jgi:hypothetical protein
MPALRLDSLNGSHLKAHAVPVPEFGEGLEAWIAELTADERDRRLEVPWLKFKEESGQEDNAGFRAFAAAACWCEGPERSFVAEDEAAIVAAAKRLGSQDSRPVTRMFAKAAEVNGLTEEATEAAEKN